MTYYELNGPWTGIYLKETKPLSLYRIVLRGIAARAHFVRSAWGKKI